MKRRTRTAKTRAQPQLRDLKALKTIKQMAADYPGLFTESSLRWLIFTNPDGFETCLIRIGRRVLIDEPALCEWLEKRRGRPAFNP